MTQIRDPMSILTQFQVKFIGYMIEKCGKEVNVLGKDRGVLHAKDSSALELTVPQCTYEALCNILFVPDSSNQPFDFPRSRTESE